MNKTTILPNIIVYNNLLNDKDECLSTVKLTESYTEKTHAISPWEDWYANWKGSISLLDLFIMKEIIDTDNDAVLQKKLIDNLIKGYDQVCKDYLSSHKDTSKWPDFIEDWDFSNKDRWMVSGISFLKYDQPNSELDGLAMNYHTDLHHEDQESRGTKQIITVTFYLNDEYEGGEISFYDDETNAVYNYKPKAGDVTVFPSGRPYYHGVLPFSGAPRYLVRMFLLYRHDGSQEWLDNELKFGKEKWAEMEKDRLHKSWKATENLLKISYDNNIDPNDHFRTVYVTKDPVWIQ